MNNESYLDSRASGVHDTPRVCRNCHHEEEFHLLFDYRREPQPCPCDHEIRHGLCLCRKFEPMTAEDCEDTE